MAYRSESRAYDAVYDPVFTKPGYNQAPSRPFDPQSASGSGRYKFFQRPMVPQMDPVAPGVVLAPVGNSSSSITEEEEDVPRTREQFAQTKYRESDTQTDPYSPDYVMPAGENRALPQVLMLAGLSQVGGTLPCGEREVLMIEHAQQKRRLMESLPPATDECSLMLRRKLLEMQELKEFQLRQDEIDDAHSERLGLLKRAIAEREADSEYVSEQRVESLRQQRIDERDAGLEAIQASRIKVLRKLSMARGRLQPPSSAPPYAMSTSLKGGRDVIAEYATYSSRVYAPIIRDGQRPDKGASNFDVARVAPSLASTAGIVDALSMMGPLPASLTQAKMANPEAILRGELRSTNERHRNQLTTDLRKMAALIDARKLEESNAGMKKQPTTGSPLPVNNNTAAVTLLERPPTPRVEPWDEEEDQLEQSIRLVQRTLRGRAVQIEMQQGKDRHIELIRELRAADEAKRREEHKATLLLLTEDTTELFDDQQSADYYRRAAVTEATLETIAGLTASAIFDQFQKTRDPRRQAGGDDDDDDDDDDASARTPPFEEEAAPRVAEAPTPALLPMEAVPPPPSEATVVARELLLDSFMANVLAPGPAPAPPPVP